MRIATLAVFACFAAHNGWAAPGFASAHASTQTPAAGSRVLPPLVTLQAMRQPDATPAGAPIDTNLSESGTRRLLDAVDWGGRRFLQYGNRTYWTADGGRSWKTRGWMEAGVKPPRPTLPDARFKPAGGRLFLSAGTGPLTIAVFDPAREEWSPAGFGRPAEEPLTAMGGDASGIYLYNVLHELSLSEDGGFSWRRVAKVDPSEGASMYEDIQAEGERILLRFKRPYGIASATGTVDGGKTWRRFPPGADVHLFSGCFKWIERDYLRSDCAPDSADRAVPVPFGKLERLFTQNGGPLFALADSGLYRFSPGPSAGWAFLGGGAAAGDWQGWILSGGIFSRQTRDEVAWVAMAGPMGIARLHAGRGKRVATPAGFIGSRLRGCRIDGRKAPQGR